MKTVIVFLFCLLSIQPQQQNQVTLEQIHDFLEKREAETKTNTNTNEQKHLGPGFEQSFRLPKDGSAMRQESLGLEAAKMGYGQSIWDKYEFHAGMTKEEMEQKRSIERNEFIKTALIIFFSVVAVISIVLIIIKVTGREEGLDQFTSTRTDMY